MVSRSTSDKRQALNQIGDWVNKVGNTGYSSVDAANFVTVYDLSALWVIWVGDNTGNSSGMLFDLLLLCSRCYDLRVEGRFSWDEVSSAFV